METKLLVTPEQLQSAATAFQTQASNIKTQHDAMLSKVRSLSSVWTGTAAEAYRNKFSALENSMNTINRMIMEHVSDLQKMAESYTTAETQAVAIADELPNSTLE